MYDNMDASEKYFEQSSLSEKEKELFEIISQRREANGKTALKYFREILRDVEDDKTYDNLLGGALYVVGVKESDGIFPRKGEIIRQGYSEFEVSEMHLILGKKYFNF